MPPVSPRNYYGYANADFARHETHIATAKIEHSLARSAFVQQQLAPRVEPGYTPGLFDRGRQLPRLSV